jgi:hypothetical protein
LRGHIASSHSDVLDAFDIGWEVLGPSGQADWLQIGIFARGSALFPFTWESWTGPILEEIRKTGGPYGPPGGFRTLTTAGSLSTLTALISKKMDHSGSLYGIPEIPLTAPVYHSPLKEGVAAFAASVIMEVEMKQILERLKKEIEQNGLDAIRKYYPGLPSSNYYGPT